jgi:hypothetical protein
MATQTLTPERLSEKAAPDPNASAEDKSKLKPQPSEKKGLASKIKSLWAGLGLDAPTLITMAKWVQKRVKKQKNRQLIAKQQRRNSTNNCFVYVGNLILSQKVAF